MDCNLVDETGLIEFNITLRHQKVTYCVYTYRVRCIPTPHSILSWARSDLKWDNKHIHAAAGAPTVFQKILWCG